jgi:hypothetical protein
LGEYGKTYGIIRNTGEAKKMRELGKKYKEILGNVKNIVEYLEISRNMGECGAVWRMWGNIKETSRTILLIPISTQFRTMFDLPSTANCICCVFCHSI